MKNKALTVFVLVFLCMIVISPSFVALFTQPKMTLKQTTVQKIVMTVSTISIDGTVYGLPLDGTGAVAVEGANVVIIGGKLIGGINFAFQKSDATNANGYYSFSDIPIGLYMMIARKPSEYYPGIRFVRLTSSQPIKHNQDITMIRKGGGSNGSLYASAYMNTLSSDEQVLLQQYMSTLSVEEQILMQQSMSMMPAN